MGKANFKGRAKGGFSMVLHVMQRSEPWRAASGPAIKLLLHLMMLSKGNNGYGEERDRGRLFLSEREAARAIGVSKNTAARALQELVELGFLRVMTKGHFDVKGMATTWRLTFQPYPHAGMAPTNEWRDWKPKQKAQAQNLTSIGSKSDQRSKCDASIGPETKPIPLKSGDQLGSISAPHIYLPQGGSGAGAANPSDQHDLEGQIAGGPFAAHRGAA